MIKNTHLKKGILLTLFMLFAFGSYAAKIQVFITSSSGGALPNGLDGLPATFKIFKGPNYIGQFNAGTEVTVGVGTHTIHALYNGTSTSREDIIITPATVNIQTPIVRNFKTTNVKFHFSGDYLQFRTSGSWRSFEKTNGEWSARELFPKDFYGNTMTILTAHVWNDRREVIFPIDYSPINGVPVQNVEKTISVIRVLSSSNLPIEGATARGLLPYAYFVSGSTNANGLLVDLQEGKKTSNSYEAKFNNTTATSALQDPTLNSYYLFNTALVTLKLETCSGAPISGGAARYTVGPYIYFYPGGATDAGGETSADLFPGTYSFEMNYQSTAETKTPVNIGIGNTTLTWKTTNVTLNWPYDIAYGGTGDLRYFDKPSMELLPGTYNFNFRAPGSYNYSQLTIGGCSMSLTPGLVQLRESDGDPISGGIVGGYQGSWSTYGTTGSNGNLLVLGKNPTSVNMNLGGGVQQLNSINFATNPIVNFQTKAVTMQFKASDNSELESTNLLYFAGTWQTFGDGFTTSGIETMEMLPVSYSFRLGYLGAVQTILNQNVNSNPLVSFQTVNAQVKLVDGNNLPLSGGIATFFASSWQSFGTTGANGIAEKEILPVPYSFRMQYSAQTKQLDGQNPAIVSPVLFTFASGVLSRIANPDATTNVAEEFRTSIYPNPTVSSINIAMPERAEAAEVKIITLDGRLVLSKVLEINNRSVNVSELPAGIYQVGVTVDGKSQIHRLVIAR